MIRVLRFNSKQVLGILLFTSVQNGSAAHPASYPMGIGLFPWG
jgi:hypothetical protein